LDGHLHKFLKGLSPPRRDGARVLDARKVTQDLSFEKVLLMPHHKRIFREEGTNFISRISLDFNPIFDFTCLPVGRDFKFQIAD
jgi:hypothetical protein